VFGTALAANDGVYELLEVGVEADPNMEAAGLRQVSVSARCENRGQQVANSQLLVRGDNRNRTADVGVTGPLYRVVTPDRSLPALSFNAGPASFSVDLATLSTMRGTVDRLTDATKVKEGVTVASTPAGGNVTLSGTQTVDGVSVSVNGTRVLVKDQTTKSQNGIYTKQTGAWTRATDADGTTELDYAQVGVASGTANGGTTWFNPNVITIGTTAYDWQQAPAFGLRESDRGGPVSISYGVELSDWYTGACTITQGGTVVTGNRLAASGAVTIDNGLVRVGASIVSGFSRLDLEMASGSPLAWNGRAAGETHRITLAVGGIVITSVAVLTNTPDVVAVRYRAGTGILDVSIMRGCRTVSVTLSNSFPIKVEPLLNEGDSPNFGSREAGSGAGFTAAKNTMLYASADDDFGNRVGLSYAGELDASDETPLGRAHAFGIHAVVGGGTTKTGDDQLYGLSREWFGMLAQQTSAGVL
jgi:hypothetical protein